MKVRSGGVAFAIAGVTTVLCWVLFFLFFHSPTSRFLFAVGNIVAGVGVLLIVFAMRTLRKRGQLDQDQDFTSTTRIVKQGIYAIVRHPLYLGWWLTYPAAMLVSQHWLIVVLGAIGMVSIGAITRLADRELSAKFGPEYERYVEQVPRLNMLWGIVKRIGRGR